MGIQSACQDLAPRLASENLSRPNCPHCGSVLLVTEESRFDASLSNGSACEFMGRIDHHWSCDDCGHRFVTSIRLRPRSTKAP
jgi:DNA-directed RNA polymerase subunit RPC12/RpoP